MNIKIVNEFIKGYKEEFGPIHDQEIYKWKAVKCFQDNWDIRHDDFHKILSTSLSLTQNLLESGNYFPKIMLLLNAQKSPKEIKKLFTNLYNEEDDLITRIESFREDFKKINTQNFPGKSDYQDHRAVLVYLVLKYPERYFFYKYKMFKEFSVKINYTYHPIRGRIENIGQFQNLCHLLRYEISKDQDLLKLHKNRITDECYYDEKLNILTQDFIFASVNHLKLKISSEKKQELSWLKVKIVKSKDVRTKEISVDFSPRMTSYAHNESENKRIGDLGELWVIDYEKNKLINLGKHNLARKIEHTSKEKGDGTGYDIISFDKSGKKIFIEVKTTKGNISSPFYVTRNELKKSEIEEENYFLYRVYNFNTQNNKANLLIINGVLSDVCSCPTQYIVKLDESR